MITLANNNVEQAKEVIRSIAHAHESSDSHSSHDEEIQHMRQEGKCSISMTTFFKKQNKKQYFSQ